MQIMDSVYMSYAAAEQGDSSSAEEVESPRSVVSAAAVRRRCGGARLRKSRHQKNYNNKKNNNNTHHDDEDVMVEERKRRDEERCYLHSQVLRIKEEEMQIEEELIGGVGIFNVVHVVDSHPLDDVNLNNKMILPASPLGAKTN